MKKHISLFEEFSNDLLDFDQLMEIELLDDDINEAAIGDALKRIQKVLQSAMATKRETEGQIERAQRMKQKSADTSSRIRERASKSKNPALAKVYAAREKEEKVKQDMYAIKQRYLQLKAQAAEAKAAVANARLQASSKK